MVDILGERLPNATVLELPGDHAPTSVARDLYPSHCLGCGTCLPALIVSSSSAEHTKPVHLIKRA